MLMKFARRNDATPIEAVPGVLRTTLAVGDRTMLVRFDLGPGSEIPPHAHAHEQTGFLVAGDLVLLTDEGEWSVEPGDSWSIPGQVKHGARSLGGAVAVETFAPIRDDYLPGPEPAPPDSGS
jgi:quercetin dioxygenase-like cupin family protein